MPRIGLLSDSHGQAETTRRAVGLLLGRGVDMLLHLGDVGGVEVLDALAIPAPVVSRLVFGNVDYSRQALSQHAQRLGLIVDHAVGWLELEGGDLVYLHGDDADAKDQALAAGVRYLCHGHTHAALDARRGPTRVINPGALFRAGKYTVALLDTASDSLEFIPVPPGPVSC